MNIGLSLQQFREMAGLSQSELARRTGIKQENISRWENNKNIPNILDCIKLAEFFQVSISELIGYEETIYIPTPPAPTQTVYGAFRSKDNALPPIVREMTAEEQKKAAETFDEDDD